MTTYKEAGVDIDLANRAVVKIKDLVKGTFNKNTLTDIGGFGGCYLFPKDKYENPVLVSSADGVGTKLKIAFLMDQHDTIGQCLVNHCTNDILAVGARPMFFLDYFATGELSIETVEEVVSGLSKACRENSCVLIGGETAEMPDFYQKNEYDMSGTIIGVVDKEFMMPLRKTNKGDVLVALPSTGLHTNGYSLARKVLLERYTVDRYFDTLGMTLGQSLLSIHKSYLPAMDAILEKDWLHGISHITGGGLVENTHRVIEDNQDIKVDWDSWEWPEIFKMIQKYGDVPIEDMRRSFNLGMGLVAIIDPNSIDKLSGHLKSINEDFIVIGEVI
jgi:phosphoribosylformylglycinamidine cyclo-ligase